MKKEEKLQILNSSAQLLKESAEMLTKAVYTDYEDFSEKTFFEKIFITINAHSLTTQALLFNMMRLIALDKEDDK